MKATIIETSARPPKRRFLVRHTHGSKSFSFDPAKPKDRARAKREAEAYRVHLEAGMVATKKGNFAPLYDEWLAYWIKTRRIGDHRAQELHRQARIIKQHLGELPVAQIDGDTVRKFLRKAAAGAVSKDSMLGCIKHSLRYAFSMKMTMDTSWEYVLAEDAPRKRSKHFLTRSEVSALVDTAEGPRKLLYALLAGTGLRCGEALGLDWDDVDLKAGTLRVCRVWSRETFTEGKTDHAQRVVPIPSKVVAMLREAKVASKGRWVFQSKADNPLDRDNLYPALKRDCKAIGIEPCGFHAFRRYYRSTMSELGVNKAVIDERMGHTPGGNIGEKYYTKASEENLMERSSVEAVL